MVGSIFYTVVAPYGKSRTTISRGEVSNSIVDIANTIIEGVDFQTATKTTTSSGSVSYTYLVTEYHTGTVCFLCVANTSFPRRLCFAFLERVKSDFISHGSVHRDFVKSEMEFFSVNPDADKIRCVQREVDDVKEVMLENIEKVLTRGERLEDIDRKTEDLQEQSSHFHVVSKKLQCQLIRENLGLSIMIGFIILFVLAVCGVLIFWLVGVGKSIK